MKETVLETLSDLGFKPELNEDMGYAFNYEGLTLLYLPNEDDDNFLSIAVPCILDCKEENVLVVTALTEKINSSLKYIKAHILASSVWLFYEREFITVNEDMTAVLTRMINRLEAAHGFGMKALRDIEKSLTEQSAEDTYSEEAEYEETSDDEDTEN